MGKDVVKETQDAALAAAAKKKEEPPKPVDPITQGMTGENESPPAIAGTLTVLLHFWATPPPDSPSTSPPSWQCDE